MANIISLILAAGKGSRMNSLKAKCLHEIGGFPLIDFLLDKSKELNANRIISVINPKDSDVLEHIKTRSEVVYQNDYSGTGGAVIAAKEVISEKEGVLLVSYCDTPLVEVEKLQEMIKIVEAKKAAVVVLGFNLAEENSYGRLKTQGSDLIDIIEKKDLKEEDSGINLFNSGIMVIDLEVAFNLLAKLDKNNAQNELYLTDVVKLAVKEGLKCSYIIDKAENLQGVNNKLDLANLEDIFQKQKRLEFLEKGVTLVGKDTIFFSKDTKIGSNCIIYPHVIFKRGVELKDNVVIEASSILEGAIVNSNAAVGPFARIREGSIIGENAKVGNFMELKKATLKNGVKANHLSYLGDCEIGENTNIGAGTITCNYDGKNKFKTKIGKNSFIGSNSALVAPIILGEGSFIGAGSTITKDVEDFALAVTRAKQLNIKDYKRK